MYFILFILNRINAKLRIFIIKKKRKIIKILMIKWRAKVTIRIKIVQKISNTVNKIILNNIWKRSQNMKTMTFRVMIIRLLILIELFYKLY